MHPTNSIAIIGAGPVGITAACALKAANPNLHITVLDKRAEPKRNHGLSIQSDSIAKIDAILAKALKAGGNDECKNLRATLNSWNGQFVRTNEIEKTLAEHAKGMGITVLRGADYTLAKGDLQAIFDPAAASELTEKQKKLEPILRAASIIIAADGAHSVVRDELGITLVEKEVLKHMVELKYQTDGAMQPRGYKDAAFASTKTGHIAVETVNRRATEDKKPATYLMFVDEPTYNSLRVPDGEKGIKGIYGNTWTLDELKKLSSKNARIKSVYNTMTRYVRGLEKRQGSCTNEQIATLELKIYRNAESVKNYHGKHILFMGDANSGLVLQRGFNKGLHEVALGVDAIGKLLNARSDEQSIPKAFKEYEMATQALFASERTSIYFKDAGITVGQKFVGSTASSMQKFEDVSSIKYVQKQNLKVGMKNMADTVSQSSNSFLSTIFNSITSLFSK